MSHIVGDEKIMKMNPVIAGGSALSVYRACNLYDSEDKWRQLERLCEIDESSPKLLIDKLDPFGDVDAWFFDDHSVHSGGYGSWLISERSNKSDLLPPLDSTYREVRSSKWANSFRRNSGVNFIFQAIKNPISSIEELFESFDYTNCCVAYHDGTLYYDSKLDSAFESFRLNLNNCENYIGDSMPKRVYSGLRAFKYSKRYHLDFSEDLSELIFNIYMDLGSVDYDLYDDKVTLVNNVYGTTLMAKNDFKDMVRSFELNFESFTKMQTFKGEYAIYLIDRPGLKGLKEYINKESPTSVGESLFENIPF